MALLKGADPLATIGLLDAMAFRCTVMLLNAVTLLEGADPLAAMGLLDAVAFRYIVVLLKRDEPVEVMILLDAIALREAVALLRGADPPPWAVTQEIDPKATRKFLVVCIFGLYGKGEDKVTDQCFLLPA